MSRELEYSGGHDPVPSKEAQNGDRAQQFVNSISALALEQLGELRDQIDDLCRQITAKQLELERDINEHIKFATAAIKAKTIISENVEKVASYFPPKPAATITHRNGNGTSSK